MKSLRRWIRAAYLRISCRELQIWGTLGEGRSVPNMSGAISRVRRTTEAVKIAEAVDFGGSIAGSRGHSSERGLKGL
jgi:hypothetical protein